MRAVYLITAKMNSSAESSEASSSLFGKLPDTVLCRILKEGCGKDTQQAAYKSCRDLRDFRDRNMKSTIVSIFAAETLEAVQARSSSTMCPKAACSIEHLTVCFEKFWACTNSIEIENAYTYLQQLTDATFFGTHPAANRRCRIQQLGHILSIRLMLPRPTARTPQHCYIVSRLLSQFSRMRTLRTSTSDPLSYINAPQLQHVVCDDQVAPQDLHLFANRHLGIEKLEFVVAAEVRSELYKQALFSCKDLKHLTLRSAVKKLLPAGLLADLKQLTNLSLFSFEISGVHRLAELNVTHLTVGAVHFRLADQQTEPVSWPAFKCIKFSDGVPIKESEVRAVLPLPQPGFSVDWPTNISYVADVAPDPQFGYICVTHMRSVRNLSLSGRHLRDVLRTMVADQVVFRTIQVYGSPLVLGLSDAADYLNFPQAVRIRLDTLKTTSPKFFYILFLQCHALNELYVPRSCLPQCKQLPQFLRHLKDGKPNEIVRICIK